MHSLKQKYAFTSRLLFFLLDTNISCDERRDENEEKKRKKWQMKSNGSLFIVRRPVYMKRNEKQQHSNEWVLN